MIAEFWHIHHQYILPVPGAVNQNITTRVWHGVPRMGDIDPSAVNSKGHIVFGLTGHNARLATDTFAQVNHHDPVVLRMGSLNALKLVMINRQVIWIQNSLPSIPTIIHIQPGIIPSLPVNIFIRVEVGEIRTGEWRREPCGVKAAASSG